MGVCLDPGIYPRHGPALQDVLQIGGHRACLIRQEVARKRIGARVQRSAGTKAVTCMSKSVFQEAIGSGATPGIPCPLAWMLHPATGHDSLLPTRKTYYQTAHEEYQEEEE